MREVRQIGDFTFETNPRGWLCAGYSGPKGHVVIPDNVDGEAVTMVGSHSFEDNLMVESIEIPEGVDFLGKYAFWGCKNLKSVCLPSTVKSLGLGLFMSCESLVDVQLPDGLETIDDGAFNGCDSLSTVRIPPKVHTIGDSAFRSCPALSHIEMPPSVTTIYRNSFRFCESLSRVSITPSVTFVGPRAFQDCPRLKSIEIVGEGDIERTLTALSDYGFMYLVADYAIKQRFMPFEKAIQLSNGAKFDHDRLLGCRMLTAYPERLDEVAAKAVVIRILAAAGMTGDLHAFEGRAGYFTETNLRKCIDAASANGHIETSAYLMDQLSQVAASAEPAEEGFFATGLEL